MQVFGEVQPYSITGSLPLVRSLQDNDYDVQLVGYGLSSKCVGCSLECYMVYLGWEWMVPIQQRGKGPTDPMVQNRTLSQHTHIHPNQVPRRQRGRGPEGLQARAQDPCACHRQDGADRLIDGDNLVGWFV